MPVQFDCHKVILAQFPSLLQTPFPVSYTHLGYFPKEDIKTFRQTSSYLQGHPDMKGVPGVDMSTGSLGQGICAANGMALAAKIDGKSYRVYSILGDGELEEGQVWEAAMFAAHYKLDNVTAFIDFNGLQKMCIRDRCFSV